MNEYERFSSGCAWQGMGVTYQGNNEILYGVGSNGLLVPPEVLVKQEGRMRCERYRARSRSLCKGCFATPPMGTRGY